MASLRLIEDSFSHSTRGAVLPVRSGGTPCIPGWGHARIFGQPESIWERTTLRISIML